MLIQTVILAGGAGVRLWPLSRLKSPKQFLAFEGDRTLFQRAVIRANRGSPEWGEVLPPMIVTNEEHQFIVKGQLNELEIDDAKVLLEPEGRNTAPAITAAALLSHNDSVLLCIPADHSFENEAQFVSSIQLGLEAAQNDEVVVFGVPPTSPNVGYGYIKSDLSSGTVEDFVEKPDEALATQYLNDGSYVWNAGIVAVKASLWLQVLESFHPVLNSLCRAAWVDAKNSDNFFRPDKQKFKEMESVSADVAVMERLPRSEFPIKMIRLEAGWSDLGSWDSLHEKLPSDKEKNTINGDVFCKDSTNNFVWASDRLVTLLGVQNVIVVETNDAVLVSSRGSKQDINGLLNVLRSNARVEVNEHQTVSRPWGWFKSIDESPFHKVKRIHVNPMSRLSLQKHQFRSEHWVVVSGTAEVEVDGERSILKENESLFIPVAATHRLSNRTEEPIEIIEVQHGPYLSEDDIIRLEDQYGRIE